MQALGRADSHEAVIGRVVFDPVDAPPLGVEAAEPRRVLVGEPPEI